MNVSLRPRWRLFAALLVIILGLLGWYVQTRGRAVAVTHIERGNIAQSVAATGRVNAPLRSDLSAEVTAQVVAVRVREADTFKAGDLLVELGDAQARASLHQAQASLQEAQNKLLQQQSVTAPQAQQALGQAQIAYEVAQREYQRSTDLVAKGFYSQQKGDESQRALEAAKSAYETAKLQAQAHTPSGVETALSQSRITQARAAVQAAANQLGKHRLHAAFDGLVLTRSTEPGNIAQPGKVLLSLSSNASLRIDTAIDEKNLHMLSLGMPAKVLADAFPDQTFDAKLQYIAPSVDPQKGTVEVRLEIVKPPAFLRTDMTVSVELLGKTRSNVWVLPAEAVRDADRNTPWVLVIRDGVATRVPVKLGLKGLGSVELVEGVTDSDDIIASTQPVAAGDKVHVGATLSRAKGFDVPQGMFR
jgi:HlyD family secretion protein